MGKREDPLLDRILGNYRLVEQIGDGAYGVVYRAEHVRLGVSYAAKILHPSFMHQENALKRFWREAQTTGRLKHEHIVSVMDFDVDPKVGPYLIMEYLEGETLGGKIQREHALSLLQVRDIAKPICLALEAAHQLGVIHRDLKPDNIFLVRQNGHETVKVLDFGIARLTEGGEALTGVGQTLGTPEYMSPEQCRGMPLTAQSDIYCFGILLHQMLTGELPFEGTDPHQHMVHHLMTPAPALDEAFPEGLRSLLLQLLEKYPENRPSTMEDVWAKLTRILPRKSQPTFPNEKALVPEMMTPFPLSKQPTPPPKQPTPSSEEVILLVKRKDLVSPTREMEAPELDDEDAYTQIDLDAVENEEEKSLTDIAKYSEVYESSDDVVAGFEASLQAGQTFEEDGATTFEFPEDLSSTQAIELEEEPEENIHISTFLDISVQDQYDFSVRYLQHIDNGGMFLPTRQQLAKDEIFFFRFSFPDGRTFVSGWGEVVRVILPDVDKEAGMYIRFTRLEPAGREVVEHLLNAMA